MPATEHMIGWPTFFTWLLVLIGWVAVHRATLSRERRKERREACGKLVERLIELESSARAFHVATSFDAHRFDVLRYETDRLISSLQRPPINTLDLPLGRMVRLRKSITLNNVDPKTFVAQSAGSAILRDIRSAVDDLIDAIEGARERQWE